MPEIRLSALDLTIILDTLRTSASFVGESGFGFRRGDRVGLWERLATIMSEIPVSLQIDEKEKEDEKANILETGCGIDAGWTTAEP